MLSKMNLFSDNAFYLGNDSGNQTEIYIYGRVVDVTAYHNLNTEDIHTESCL
jgi:hypothetical protein